MRSNDSSACRQDDVREKRPEGEILPWLVGMVVIFAASAVCWALIYAVFISSYHFLTSSH